MRFYFLAATVHEDGDSTEGEFGANVDVYFKPIVRTPRLLFRLDEAKNRFLALRMGYRYLPSFTGDPTESRAVLEATGRHPLMGLWVRPFGSEPLRFPWSQRSPVWISRRSTVRVRM